MSLPAATVPRTLKHTRSITVEAYARDDGLWDIEGHLVDTKTRDFPLAAGLRRAGEPVHDMWLRLTIDRGLNIIDAVACSDRVPYPGHCDTIGPAYRSMVGLNLGRGFKRALTERLGGVAGCTHITELATVLPTAAIQAFAGEVYPTRDASQGGAGTAKTKPFQLDRCHALRTDGPAVMRYYPEWYHPASEPEAAGPTAPEATAAEVESPPTPPAARTDS